MNFNIEFSEKLCSALISYSVLKYYKNKNLIIK